MCVEADQTDRDFLKTPRSSNSKLKKNLNDFKNFRPTDCVFFFTWELKVLNVQMDNFLCLVRYKKLYIF